MAAEITAICKPRWVNQVLTTTLTGTQPAELRLAWRTDSRARARLEDRIFGNRILFTNRATTGAPATSWPPTARRTESNPGSGR